MSVQRVQRKNILDDTELFHDHTTRPTHFEPPGIEPSTSCLGPIPFAPMLYRQGECSCSAGTTNGVVLSHGASQPSPGFQPPPVGWEPCHMPFNCGDDTDVHASGGWGYGSPLVGAVAVIATCHALSTAAKRRGAIWAITCGVVLCRCACGAFWWVLCKWSSHRACAVMAPVRFLLPAWHPPPKRRTRRSSCCERLTEPVGERTAAGGGGVVFALCQGGGMGQAQKDLKSRRGAPTAGRQCRWRSVLLQGVVVNVDDRRVRTSDAGVPAYGVDGETNPSLLCSLAYWAAHGTVCGKVMRGGGGAALGTPVPCCLPLARQGGPLPLDTVPPAARPITHTRGTRPGGAW